MEDRVACGHCGDADCSDHLAGGSYQRSMPTAEARGDAADDPETEARGRANQAEGEAERTG